MDFIAIGDNCIDYYIDSNKKYAGGNAVNFAVYINQLGQESSYFGVVGDDENGRIIIQSLKEQGIDTSFIRMAEGRTAVTEVQLKNGDRVLGEYDEGVFANFSITPQELAWIKQHPYIHTAIWGKCDAYLQELHRTSIISYDFANKYDLERIKEISKYINYGFISYDKDDHVIRSILRVICENGADAAIATLGENGSLAYDGFDYIRHGVNSVDVVDTLGAGDSFIAGFMYGIAAGKDLKESLISGTDKASKTIQYFGAW
ncbi:fructoselysine 6-kinase [Mesobacillus foraminis]|uniref:fructoselysine 6-kinase n=1 Tax=Mesobacillus foraminis TaxID=279826 RepID=UPI0039A1E91F